MKTVAFNFSIFIGCMMGCVYLRRNEPEPEMPQQVQPAPIAPQPIEHDEEPQFYDDEEVEV